jgi:hypothetical protein
VTKHLQGFCIKFASFLQTCQAGFLFVHKAAWRPVLAPHSLTAASYRIYLEVRASVSAVCCAVACAAGLLFFTTYTLLVLFWAEIYHQARSMPTGSLRPIFIAFNALVYACQVCCSPR